jgi:hypothetical protein
MAKTERVRRTSPIGIASFVHLFVPQQPREGSTNKEPKYKMILCFDTETAKSQEMRDLKLACIAAAEAKFGDKAREQIKKGKIAMPWRDNSDYEENGPPFDQPGIFINFSSKDQPGIVDRKAKPITNASAVYSGMRARATYGVWAYDTNGNRGVTVFLNNVQKVADGERLAGRPEASDDFEAVAGEDGTDDDVDDII